MEKNKNESSNKSDVLQRLAQASIEGLVMDIAMSTLIPGSGIAINGLRQGKKLKKAAKVMGKSAGKEGVKMLDDEENKSPTEELSEDFALEFLSRAGNHR